MTVYHEAIGISTEKRVTFHDVTDQVVAALGKSKVADGILVVYSQHTTCSVFIQEESHDTTLEGTEYLLQDLLEVLGKVAPTCRRERDYLHPGPKHLEHAETNLGEEGWWSLNTDGHLRSVLMGRSESIPVVNGAMQLGEFGRIFFADFDAMRARERTVRVQIVGE